MEVTISQFNKTQLKKAFSKPEKKLVLEFFDEIN